MAALAKKYFGQKFSAWIFFFIHYLNPHFIQIFLKKHRALI